MPENENTKWWKDKDSPKRFVLPNGKALLQKTLMDYPCS